MAGGSQRWRRRARGAVALVVTALVPLAAMVPSATAEPVATTSTPTAVSAAAVAPDARFVGIASTPAGDGFWIAASDGAVVANGAATHYGDVSGIALTRPVVGIVATASGKGYWLVAADGGIFAFGDAPFHGSTGALALNRPVVSMAPTPSGGGYWMVATDGGIFAFGDAAFYGSMGAVALNKPVNGMTVSPTGNGYRLVASDGGVFSFGDVPFLGSLGGEGADAPIVGMAASAGATGYWLATSAGEVAAFGTARAASFPFEFNFGAWPVTAIAGNPKADGYRAVTSDGATWPAGPTPPGGTAATRPLVDPNTPRGTSPTQGAHAFTTVGPDGQPGRWDPCTPISVSVDLHGGPSSWADQTWRAFQAVTAGSGLAFVPASGPGRPDIVVVFESQAENPRFAGPSNGGYGGSGATSQGRVVQLSNGSVHLNTDSVFFQSTAFIYSLLLHEIAHAIGLDHVSDRNQVMVPSTGRAYPGYGPGDLEGLWNVGAARGCLRPSRF